MGKVQIGAAIGESFRFVGEAWRRAWGIMLILVWFSAATGALYRLRFSGDHPGDDAFAAHPAGLQWGGLEWRVLGANLLVGLIIGVLAFVVFIIWAFILGVTLGNSPADVQGIENGSEAEKLAALGRIMLGPAGALTLIFIGPAVLGLIYVGLRLSVFAPFAAETRSFDPVKAWALSRGAVLALLIGSVVIFLLELVIGGVFGGVAGFVAGFTGQVGQGRIWGGVAGQTVGAALNAPLIAGLVLYVYRTQRGDSAVAATFS